MIYENFIMLTFKIFTCYTYSIKVLISLKMQTQYTALIYGSTGAVGK